MPGNQPGPVNSYAEGKEATADHIGQKGDPIKNPGTRFSPQEMKKVIFSMDVNPMAGGMCTLRWENRNHDLID
jgi:hypothetical protein